MDYLLEFAGIPFVGDTARVVRMDFTHSEQEAKEQLPPRKHQPLVDLVDELNRILPFQYLNDFAPRSPFPGRNLGAIALQEQTNYQPNQTVRIGDWYYPNGASRWSVFRGLATSTMVKKMLDQTLGTTPKTFKMKARPVSPNPNSYTETNYSLETSMYMLPPRPLAEHGGSFDGLYLVTLVDTRYYWQYSPVTLKPNKDSTWASLISTIGTALGVTINLESSVQSVYGQPEPDSQLWVNQENAAILLDAIAYSIGRIVVRKLDGTFTLYTPVESQTLVGTNRGNTTKVVRTAGGDIFYSGNQLPAKSLIRSRNSIVPDSVSVAFPKYVQGNDPVPHFLNSRYANQRPSCWYEESYGDTHNIVVPIASGGPRVSGLSGVSDHSIHTTAKALYSGEIQASGNPMNVSGLTALAMQISQDYYDTQVAFALDEVYPGTYKWNPEGIHDIVWTYSEQSRQASTRVLRSEWNQIVREMQHSAPALSGETNVTIGVGGPSVAQTWRDNFVSGVNFASGIYTALMANLASGDATATFQTIDNFPTQNRWRGQIENEKLLFEGTSGGTAVGIVWRGIDGTLQVAHNSGVSVNQIPPNTTYGVNLVSFEKGQFAFPGAWTSGGIQEVVILPQTQTVQCLAGTYRSGGTRVFLWSGRLQTYDTVQLSGSEFRNQELVWIAERNQQALSSGQRYDGQLVGHSVSGVAPIYLVNLAGTGGSELQTLLVRAATTTNIDITNPPSTIDNITPTIGDLIWVRSQTTASENWLYIWNGAGVALTAYTGSITKGTTIYVKDGPNFGGQFWTNQNDPTYGSVPPDFSQTGGTDVVVSTSETNTLLYDTFTDADGTNLTAHTMNVGAGWTVLAGSFDINGNQARYTGFGADNDAIATADAGNANVDVSCKVTPVDNSSGDADGIVLRVSGEDDWWEFTLTDNTVAIADAVGGVITLRASTAFTFTANTQYSLRFTSNGTVLVGTVNGGYTTTYSSATTNQTVTTHGIRASHTPTGTKFDDFLCVTTVADNSLVRFDGTGGRDVQSTNVIIDDSDNIVGPTGVQTTTSSGDTVSYQAYNTATSTYQTFGFFRAGPEPTYDTLSREVIDNLATAELISGLKAVAYASGGTSWIRAERQSGFRLPAIGVAISGAVSGTVITVVTRGVIYSRVSGMIASGFHGQGLKYLYVGSGGLITNQSGFMGGLSSGDAFLSGSLVQRIGRPISGGIYVDPELIPSSGLVSGLLGQW